MAGGSDAIELLCNQGEIFISAGIVFLEPGSATEILKPLVDHRLCSEPSDGARVAGLVSRRRPDPTTIEYAVAKAVVDGVFKIGGECGTFKTLAQQRFEEKRVECVVEVGDEVVGGSLLHRFYHSAVSPHGLYAAHHFSHGRDHPVAELPFAEVGSLLKPRQLPQERASDRDQAGEDEDANALSGHGCKFRGIPTSVVHSHRPRN